MKKNSIVGLTGILLGVAGCGNHFNKAPEVNMYELDGTLINPTVNNQIVESEFCDVEVMLPINRGDIIEGRQRLAVVAKDSDGPEPIDLDIYASTVADNPINIEIYDRMNTLNENGSEARAKINITTTEKTHLGTYRMVVVSASDGKNTKNYCVYGIVSPTASAPPEQGGLPQDDGSTLERLIEWGCEGLPRSTENDLILYRVIALPNGKFSYEVVPELDRNTPEGEFNHYLLPTTSGGKYFVLVEGNTKDGVYGEVINVRNKLTSPVGIVPEECSHLNVINPNGEDLSSERFTAVSHPEF